MIHIGMATFGGRKKAVEQAVSSLELNRIPFSLHLYDNDVRAKNIFDNGKFVGLIHCKPTDVYFSCDDDLLYPSNYIENTMLEIESGNAIATHHGRILVGLNANYYHGHTSFRCLDTVSYDGFIDVCGTGVSAYDLSKFNPISVAFDNRYRCTDLLVSLLASEKKVPIKMIPHDRGYIQQVDVDDSTSIYHNMVNNQSELIKLANEIYLNNRR